MKNWRRDASMKKEAMAKILLYIKTFFLSSKFRARQMVGVLAGIWLLDSCSSELIACCRLWSEEAASAYRRQCWRV